MRFIYGKGWVYEAPAGDGTEGGAAGGGDGAALDGGDKTGGEGGVDGAGDVQLLPEGEGTPAGGEPKGEATPKQVPVTEQSLKAALDKGLGYDKEAKAAEELKAAETKAATELAAKIEAGGKHANGTPKLNAKGEPQDEAGVAAPVKKGEAKVKTSAELALKPEEEKLLAARTRERFGELIGTVKTLEGNVAQLTEKNAQLEHSREGIVSALKDTRTTPDGLMAYLEFNELVTSGNPGKLQEALRIVNEQRSAIAEMLGVEVEGVDLLAAFPDLKEHVENETMTRKAALEVAKSRRADASRTANDNNITAQKRARDAETKAVNDGLDAIEAWQKKLQGSDVDFKAKEGKLVDRVAAVIKNYEPRLWVSTLQMLYDGIVIEKAAAPKVPSPLRPSSPKPGAPQAKTLQEAIDAGLGYTKAVG